MLIFGYHKPTLPHRDDYVLDLIDALLSDGLTSRLHRRLVEEEKAAVSAHTINGFPGSRYDNIFAVISTPRSPHTPEEVEGLILEELERLKEEPAAEKELAGIKKRMEAGLIRRLDSNSGLASMLSYYQALAGDWRYLTRHREILDSITPEEIMEVARRYFTPENRTSAYLKRAP
jgi:predicted Zn-dependent peptidase